MIKNAIKILMQWQK